MFTFIQSRQKFKQKATVLGSAIALMLSASAFAQSASGANAGENLNRFDRGGQQSGGNAQLDRSRFEVVDTFTGITTPHGVKVMPVQKKLWVANESMNTASRIDIASGDVETVVQVSAGPDLIATDKLRQKV